MARHWKINAANCLDPGELKEGADALNLPDDFWGLANSYSCPLGLEPGSAWVVVTRAVVDALDMDAYHTVTITSEYDTATITNLSVVRAICTAQDGDAKAAYLIELHDIRRVLKMSSVAKQYNVRAPAALYDTGDSADIYHSETINTSTPWTWAEMFADLWDLLPTIAGAAPALPYAPLGQPENFRFLGMSAWDAIGEVLQEIGCAISLNPLTGVFSVVRMGTTQAGLAASMTALERRLLFDYKPKPQLHRGEMPETIRVFFPRREVHRGTERETPRTGNWEAAPLTAVDTATNIAGAAPGTVMAVWSQLPAFANFDGSVNNQAELDARAAEIAENIENKIDVGERLRKHYSGIATTILPGAQINEVVWRDYGNEDGQITEIRQNIDLDAAATDGAVRRCRFWPAHNKHAQPAYPDLLHIVEVKGDSVGVPTGDQAQPTIDGLYYGSVTRYNPTGGGFTVAEDCWIELVNESELMVGQRYLGRLNGSATSEGTNRAVFLIEREKPGTSGILFTLTENMTGNVASASIDLSWGRFPVADEGIEPDVWVFDLQQLFPSALEGAQGIAIWDQDTEIYHVVECQSIAGELRFQLTGNLRAGSASASVIGWGGTQQDFQQPVGSITVYDDEAFFRGSITGCRGYAVWDVRAARYTVIQADSKAGWIIATIGQDGDLAGASLVDFGGTQQDTFTPDTYTLVDSLGLLNAAGDVVGGYQPEQDVFAIYDVAADNYVIVALGSGGKVAMRVTLTEDRDADGFEATIDGTALEIKVYDSQGLFLQAKSGAKGIVVWCHRDQRWELAECQSRAGGIKFTLTENMGGTTPKTASASADVVWGSQQDTVSPGSTVTVVDEANLFPQAMSGAAGVAVYDNENDRYMVVACEQLAMFAMAELTFDMLSAYDFGDIQGIDALPCAPFVQTPDDVTQAGNPYSLAGEAGDLVYLARTDTEWMIVQVLHQVVTAITAHRYDTSTRKLQYKSRDIVVMVNGDESDWVDETTAVEC